MWNGNLSVWRMKRRDSSQDQQSLLSRAVAKQLAHSEVWGLMRSNPWKGSSLRGLSSLDALRLDKTTLYNTFQLMTLGRQLCWMKHARDGWDARCGLRRGRHPAAATLLSSADSFIRSRFRRRVATPKSSGSGWVKLDRRRVSDCRLP